MGLIGPMGPIGLMRLMRPIRLMGLMGLIRPIRLMGLIRPIGGIVRNGVPYRATRRAVSKNAARGVG